MGFTAAETIFLKQREVTYIVVMIGCILLGSRLIVLYDAVMVLFHVLPFE